MPGRSRARSDYPETGCVGAATLVDGRRDDVTENSLAESECRYRKRRWHHPDHQQRQLIQGGQDVERAVGDLVHSTSGALVARRMLPLKRCRLRASPATGLVGMQENDFLNYFFGCVGFLPLTDESQVRETMVKIMVPTASRPEPVFGSGCFDEEGQFGSLGAGDMSGNVSGMNQLLNDPAFCTFWCAVAVGGLAKGSPIESVERYSELAREALVVSRSGSTGADLAKASASLAYLHSFMGDRGKFQESLTLAESFLQASTDEEPADLRVGIADLLLRCRLVGNDSMTPPGIQEEAPPQFSEIRTEGDLCRFVTQSFRAFHEAAYAKAYERCGGDLDLCYPGESLSNGCRLNHLPPREVSEAIAEVLGTGSSLEPIQEMVDRSGVRAGIGGLFVNGALVFEKAAEGDLHATLERLGRSVEVYERYPGLCRCMVGYHMSHMLLASLAAIDDPKAQGMYDSIRGAYNSCRVSHAVIIPPLEEWQGMEAICGDLHCRAIGTLIESEHMKAFSSLPVNCSHDGAGLKQADRDPHKITTGGASPTGNDVHRKRVDLVPGPPPSSWAGSNTTRETKLSRDPNGAACSAEATVAPLASPLRSSSKRGKEFDSNFGTRGVPPVDLVFLPAPAGVGGHRQDIAEPEGDEIAAADWLEASYAMLDAVHTS